MGTRMTPGACRSCADVDALCRQMYGGSLAEVRGVVHVTAVWPDQDGALMTMRISDETPASEHDFFALNLTRARSDAILVTGAVLRAEPTLRYVLAGPSANALLAWRRERVGRNEPPRLLVLTSGRDFDRAHPALQGWARPVILTDAEGKARLGDVGHEVVALDAPSPGAAVAWARDQGAETVSIEAGPSTTRPFYEGRVPLDELLLSTFRGSLSPSLKVPPPLPREDGLLALFGASSPPYVVDEPSGIWVFQRFASPLIRA